MPGSETLSPSHPFSLLMSSRIALIGTHLIAEERRNGEGCYVPGLGDELEMDCPKSPMWKSKDEAWSENESVSSGVSRENNVCNCALYVIGLYGPGDRISLSSWRIGCLQGWR